MAMYYYARKLQKARKPKTAPVIRTSSTANGVIPNSTAGAGVTAAVANLSISSPSTSSNSTVEPCTSRTHVSPSGLVFQDTKLVAGTFEALLEHLVPTETYYPDRAYTFAFLLASRLHVPPHEVLGRVFNLTLAVSSASATTAAAAALPLYYKKTDTMSHMIQLLGEWTQLFPYDFRDERMMAHVRTITEKCVSADSEVVREEVSHLLTTLLGRLTALERHEAFLHRMTTETALTSPLTAPSILTVCPSPPVLAQQLAHLELERLAHIGAEEFLQIQVGFLKDSTPAETPSREVKTTRNLEFYLRWHHRLSFYVATEICKMPKKKLRVRVLEHWIETARECFNIGNFNSLMAIITAFNMSPVERLKKTWSKADTAQLLILDQQIDPYNNFVSYRALLQSLVSRAPGATDERQKLVIPFMSLLVKDLCFLSQECASKSSNGQINVDKFWQLSKQVMGFMTWQKVPCPFPKVESVISSLQTLPVFTESALFLASYDCEPPYKSNEKEHAKSLREQQEESRGKQKPQPSSSSSTAPAQASASTSK